MRHMTLFALIAAMLICTLSASQAAPPPPSPCAEQVRAAAWTNAVTSCTEELRAASGKQRAGLLVMRSAALIMTGKLSEAVEDLTGALDIEPMFAPAYIARATCYIELGDCKRAMVDLTQAIQLEPAVAGPYAYRAVCEFREGDYDAAGRDASASIGYAPNPMAYNIRAGVAARSKDYAHAASNLEASLALDPSNAGVAYNLSCAYALLGKSKEACKWLGQSVALGYKNRAQMESDPDLESIRGSECYGKALASIGKER